MEPTLREPRHTIAALYVGGMVIARAVNDRGFANELCDSAMAVALKLAGWEGSTKPKSGHVQRHKPRDRQ